MQLDVFTPLKGGSQAAEDIAQAIGVGAARLRLLLYSLVAAGLLTEEHGHFSNTSEVDQFLVKGGPAYIGGGLRRLYVEFEIQQTTNKYRWQLGKAVRLRKAPKMRMKLKILMWNLEFWV